MNSLGQRTRESESKKLDTAREVRLQYLDAIWFTKRTDAENLEYEMLIAMKKWLNEADAQKYVEIINVSVNQRNLEQTQEITRLHAILDGLNEEDAKKYAELIGVPVGERTQEQIEEIKRFNSMMAGLADICWMTDLMSEIRKGVKDIFEEEKGDLDAKTDTD